MTIFLDTLRWYNYNKKNGTDIAAFYEATDLPMLIVLFQNLVKSEIRDFHKAKEEAISEEKRAALLKTFRAFEELGKYRPLIRSYASNKWYETRHLILDDQALFYIGGSWMYSHWHGIDKGKMKKMVPVELPVFQEVDYYMGGYVPTWAVFKDAPNRENAIKLLMFWSKPKVAEKWVRYTKSPTGLRGHFTAAEIGMDVFEQFQNRISSKYGAQVHLTENAGYLLGKENQLLQEEINKKILELLEGQITGEEAYHQIVSKLQ